VLLAVSLAERRPLRPLVGAAIAVVLFVWQIGRWDQTGF
jgi:hypothetical protein